MAIPTNLPARYEIRTLEPKHSQWAAAIVVHSNVFYSTVFPLIYKDTTARFNAGIKAAGHLVDHQINSGLSLGVFDTEYQYRRPESATSEGKFYWDANNNEATGDELLEAMDFPLVSVALAYDGMDPLDPNGLVPLIAVLPVFATIYHHLDELDPRDPDSWRKPTERNRLLMRNATSTRHEYEGKGIMAALARYLMRTSADKGFKMANIECLSDAVTHVWANPPSPFRGEVVASFRSEKYEEKDEEGKVVKPFHPAKQLVTRVCTTLSD